MQLLHSFQSEWLKTKRSMAFWLCLFGGFFVPLIFFATYLYLHTSINMNTQVPDIWVSHFTKCWRNMAILLLPAGVILTSSLITQLEYKNNTWKQLHTTPQSLTVVFASKLLVIVGMIFMFFVFFNIGIILSGEIPCLMFNRTFSDQPIPYEMFFKENVKFFLACLPVIAFQYLVSLRFKNFIGTIGLGLLVLICTIIASEWEYVYFSPFSYSYFIIGKKLELAISSHWLALGYTAVLLAVAYFLYITRKEKG